MGYILLPYICSKRIICQFKWARDIMFLVKNDKVLYGLVTSSSKRATYRVRNALAQCQFARTGGGCPMVGNKLISKPADGLHSTAIYLLKGDNLPIQSSTRYHIFCKKWQRYVWSIGKVDRPSDLPNEERSRSVSIPAPRWWVSDVRNEINIKTRRWATFYYHIFVERG